MMESKLTNLEERIDCAQDTLVYLQEYRDVSIEIQSAKTHIPIQT